jgi:uncharacterized repeat protein (TIGR04076 family)
MAHTMSKCKITVLKRTLDRDLAAEYMEKGSDLARCERFKEGQEFLLDHPFEMPAEFCPWAWADIRNDILTMASGGNLSWMKLPGVAIAGCTDGMRPVIFEIERID